MDVWDFFFFCSGRGKGESEAPGGGGGVIGFLLNFRGGGVGSRRGMGQGAGRVSAANWGIFGGGGGGLNIFFGAEMSTENMNFARSSLKFFVVQENERAQIHPQS